MDDGTGIKPVELTTDREPENRVATAPAAQRPAAPHRAAPDACECRVPTYQPRSHSSAHPDPVRTIDRMLAHDSRTPPITRGERRQLERTLSAVNPELLRYAEEHGVKFTVGRPGERMQDLGIDGITASSRQSWAGSDGRIDTREESLRRQKSVVLGSYFPGQNRILVRSDALPGDTPIHELGHAIDHIVQKEDPAFYRGWSMSLKRAYEQAGKRPNGAISSYSRTNLREYFAEGFAEYHTDPKLLKRKDPALYHLVQDLNRHAVHLSREDERESRSF